MRSIRHRLLIESRTVEIAKHMVKTKRTIRQTAAFFGLSKSTIYQYLKEVLPDVRPTLYSEVREVLEKNKKARSYRGGSVTQLKSRGVCPQCATRAQLVKCKLCGKWQCAKCLLYCCQPKEGC